MPEINQDVEVYQGERKTLRFTVTKDGVALSLSGKSARFTVSRRAGDSEFIIDKTEEDFEIADSNKYLIPLEESDTIDSEPRDYYLELRVWEDMQFNVVAAVGTFTLKESRTKIEV